MRFVVVEIPDNEEAGAFVDAIEKGLVFYGKAEEGEVKYSQAITGWKVPQMYAVPTKFCDCPSYKGESVKSSKYGWWVHIECAKPRPGNMMHPKNLLEVDKPSEERVYYMGFRADRQGWRIAKEKP